MQAGAKHCRKTIRIVRYCFIILMAAAGSGCTQHRAPETRTPEITLMTGFPADEPGIDKGVSAAYAGIHDGKIYMAGGCNFPGTPASEGGAKRYYKGIYTADTPKDNTHVLRWKKTGELPVAAAYGVSVSTSAGVICIGGIGDSGAVKSTCIIRYDSGRDTTTCIPLPDLPYTMDNMCGACLNNTIYIAGGNAGGKPSNNLLTLNLDSLHKGWRQHPPFPGNPRLQPACAITETESGICFSITGGYSPASENREAQLDAGGYTYSFRDGVWHLFPPSRTKTGKEIPLSGATSVQLDSSTAIFYGGVDASIFSAALNREQQISEARKNGDSKKEKALSKEKKRYMEHTSTWYRFNKKMLKYEAEKQEWGEAATSMHFALAGSSAAVTGDTLYIIGGEKKPGIRTTQIVRVVLK